MKKELIIKSSKAYIIRSKTVTLVIAFLLLWGKTNLAAQSVQDKEAAYKKAVTGRSAKIVETLEIPKERKRDKLTGIIAAHYFQLNRVHDDSTDTQAHKSKELELLHQKFIAKLNSKLSPSQVEKVKNAMTYNVLNVTYAAYQDMIMTLTGPQKEKIYSWLLEAREKAMMEGSSEAKHKMFGKYKGKINNYLSEQGYNMKAEEKAWQQRLKEKREREAAGKQQGA